jgi:glutamate/tyrosine decarboxylase-like PLP-dependent enzyme
MNDDEVLKQLMTIVQDYYGSRRDGKFLEYKSPGELVRILDLDRSVEPADWHEIFRWVEQYLTYSIKSDHPFFVNRMWGGANLPSIVGEMITAVSNTSACTYESAPVSTLMEKYMIGQMLDLVGFIDGEGQMTTGSSNANMIAMMAARNTISSSAKKSGLFGRRPLFAFVGGNAHYSMDKAANTIGIGIDHLIKIPYNLRGEMKMDELEMAMDQVLADEGVPFFVAATAGTTVRGSYDSIEQLLELRDKYHFWLHVDGAWGGAAVVSEKLRKRYLKGLESADSFTCDFHKMFGSSLMCNILLINRGNQVFNRVLAAGDGSYLFRDEHDSEVDDFGAVSLQCGRRVDSLKWFLDWKFFGREGFCRRIEGYLELCEYAEELVNGSELLEMVAPRTSFNVCFRFKFAEEEINNFNLALRTRLYQQGTCLVSIAYIENDLCMRLLVTDPVAEKKDIYAFFQLLEETGKALQQEWEQ